MIGRLKKAISRRLRDAVPEVGNRYTHNPSQNMREPCFIIECVGAASKDLLTADSEKEVSIADYLFSVTLLLPGDSGLLNELVPRVLLCLKWLRLEDGKPVLTLNRQGHPIDDESYCFTFSIQREVVTAKGDDPLMEEMKGHIGCKK